MRALPTLLLPLLLAAACSGAKGRAEADVAAADRAVTALPADAAKVVPDQLTPLTDAVNQGKDQLAKGDYAAASASVREVAAQTQLLADSLPARKARLAAAMDTLAVAMPRNLAAIKAKLDSIAMAKRLPRGLDEQELQEAKDTYAAVGAEWAEVMKAYQAGELATALMADPEKALEEQVREELKIGEATSTPMREGWVTGVATAFGALIPVAPLLLSRSPWAIWTSFGVAMLSHFGVGAARSFFTGRGVIRSGLDMFVVGLGVAVLGYLVGDWIVKVI